MIRVLVDLWSLVLLQICAAKHRQGPLPQPEHIALLASRFWPRQAAQALLHMSCIAAHAHPPASITSELWTCCVACSRLYCCIQLLSV